MENQEPPEPIPGIDRPLTPAECKRLADSFADLPPQFQLSAEDLELMEEEGHGKAMRYGTPQEAIAAMQRRLAGLTRQKAETLNALDDCTEELRQSLLNGLETLNRQIAATQQRLDAYQLQLRQEN
jgi:hypothetical protein